MRGSRRRLLIRISQRASIIAIAVTTGIAIALLWLTPSSAGMNIPGGPAQMETLGMTGWWCTERFDRDGRIDYVWVPGLVLAIAITVSLLWASICGASAAATAISRWRPGIADGRCAECAYDLTGLTSAQCPECGASIDPIDDGTAHDEFPVAR